MRMYFVQIRRTMRALYWYIGAIIVILAMMSIFGNVIIRGSVHSTFEYRPPHSHQTFHVDLPYWSYAHAEVNWPAFPWGHLDQTTSFQVPRMGPRHPITFPLAERHYVDKVPTSVGTFIVSDRRPRQLVVIYPSGYRHIIHVLTVKAPDGRPAQWHDEFQMDGLNVFNEPLALPWTLTVASLLCALLGVVVGVGLGDDVANHLSIVRTRPVGKTAFVASAIGIDVALLTLGVAIMGMLLFAVPRGWFQYPVDPGRADAAAADAAAKVLSVCLVWSLALACYGLTLALTTAAKRVTALVVLSVVAVVELMISSSIGFGLPHPLDWLKPALDALNPISHYAIVFANIFRSSEVTDDAANSTAYNLGALIGLASIGMLVATLRWRAARI
jgi:hypothetical protein